MTVFIDKDYKCHVSDDGAMTAVETDFFDNKCAAFIEGYRYIPQGETWINPQGVECSGVSPWKDYNILAAAQAQYEEMLPEMEDMRNSLNKFGVTDNE